MNTLVCSFVFFSNHNIALRNSLEREREGGLEPVDLGKIGDAVKIKNYFHS